jgi:hypothetical protein
MGASTPVPFSGIACGKSLPVRGRLGDGRGKVEGGGDGKVEDGLPLAEVPAVRHWELQAERMKGPEERT